MTGDNKLKLLELIRPWERLHHFMVNAGIDLVGNGERQFYATDITDLIVEAERTLLELRKVLPQSACHEMEQRFHYFSFQAVPLPHSRNSPEKEYLHFPDIPGQPFSYKKEKPYWVYANEDLLIKPLGDWIERWKRLAETETDEPIDEVGKKQNGPGAPKRSTARAERDRQILREWAEYKADGRSRDDLARHLGITVKRIEQAQDAERKACTRKS